MNFIIDVGAARVRSTKHQYYTVIYQHLLRSHNFAILDVVAINCVAGVRQAHFTPIPVCSYILAAHN